MQVEHLVKWDYGALSTPVSNHLESLVIQVLVRQARRVREAPDETPFLSHLHVYGYSVQTK